MHALAVSALLLPASALGAFIKPGDKWGAGAACTSGSCSYLTGDGVKRAFASVRLQGASSLISDLTPAAGWEILGCDPAWESGEAHVTIRCTTGDAACAALFEGDAADTIVRLPDDCGTGPFARVVRTEDVTKRGSVWRRAVEEHAVVLDYDFSQIQRADGDVSFAITTSNVKGVVPEDAGAQSFSLGQSFAAVSSFKKTKTIDLPPIGVHEEFELFKTSIDCPVPAEGGAGFSAGLDVDLNVDLDAQVGFGFAVEGHIFPPMISKMQLIGKLNGSASAIFNIDAYATGKLDTGLIQLYKAGLPGLNLPGIIELGPQFVVNGKLQADLEVEANIKTGVSWSWPDVQLAFPPDDDSSSSAQTSHLDTPFKLSLDPSVTADGIVEAHVIPRVELGVKILSGIAKASIYLDLDASAKLDLHVEASASVEVGTGDSKTEEEKVKEMLEKLKATLGMINIPIPVHNAPRAETKAEAEASGCAKLDGGIDIYAGAQGSIAGIFDKDAKFDIYKTELNVFDKCFGASTKPQARLRTRSLPPALPVGKRDLVCPDLSLGRLFDALSL
ncbi:hypothetical protein AURDEDRAFT_112184 [Auricularia subglabra TFB-10046 SS5]|nr:hypothetical protein AURDEDRAFT_112184 [Auricularia subglabra TFB-10046 SS5]